MDKIEGEKMSCTRVSKEDFLEAQDSYLGWCTTCKDFTGECCEPDAHKYECPECGNNTVYGAEEALIMGFICF